MILIDIHNFLIDQNKDEYKSSLSTYYNKIEELTQQGDRTKKIGFFGQPDQKTMDIFNQAGYDFLDLDINSSNPNRKMVPEVTCHIIQDIVNNALFYQDQLDYIICTTSADKCDQGRNTMHLLSNLNFKLIDASNFNSKKLREPIISQAYGSLKKRIVRIMELVYNPLTKEEIEYYKAHQCESQFNFHGVPPRDIDLLENFPDKTHIEGWIKLVEMGIPSRVDLEWKIEKDVPTIFYTQSFCNKQMMAQFYANKTNGLYLDGHESVTGSMKAKLEAFLRLRSKERGIKKIRNEERNNVVM